MPPASTDRESYKVVFLTGALRSGTTMLRLLLGHHPSISRCDEMEYVAPIIADPSLLSDVDRAIAWLALHRQYRQSGYTFDGDVSVQSGLLGFLDQRFQAR